MIFGISNTNNFGSNEQNLPTTNLEENDEIDNQVIEEIDSEQVFLVLSAFLVISFSLLLDNTI